MSAIVHRSAAELHEIAEKFDCVCYIAQANELVLDIDEPISIHVWKNRHERMLDFISRQFSTELEVSSWISRGGNLHVSVKLLSFADTGDEIPYPVMIGLQAVLGSDPIKEVALLDEYTEWYNNRREGEKKENTRALFVPKVPM